MRKIGLILSFLIPALVFVVVAVFMGGCESKEIAKAEENKAVIRRFIEAINNRDLDLLDELMTPDFVRHSQATPNVQVRSRGDFKRFVQRDLTTFPDAAITIEMLVAEGDMVGFYGTFAGTQEGQMGPFPPSRKRMEVEMGAIFRLEGGKIAELWVTWDNVAGLTQLGHFSPPGEDQE
ncbi:MAG: ester cyclase [Bacteroidota bacterium]